MAAGKRNYKIKYKGLPKKGTKKREMLRLMMRHEGVSMAELTEAGCGCASGSHRQIESLRDDGGWDIRTFPCPEDRKVRARGRPTVVYKVVGRVRWDGSYRSLVNDYASATAQ